MVQECSGVHGFGEGIPIIYYGSEQMFNGGGDQIISSPSGQVVIQIPLA